jgi:diguanylate cyclase (GGDEF)-like protein
VPRFVFGQAEDLTERRAAEAKMTQQALTDWLTGLPNRRRLQQHLNEVLADHPGEVGVLFIDLVGFKQVNDRYGHEVGDHALRRAADGLAAAVGDTCTLARLGGDEFVVVLDKGDGDAVTELAERLRALEIESGAADVVLRLSVGAVVARDGESPEHVLRRADSAMYQWKQAGRAPLVERSPATGWV